ncbi:MAG: 5-formyltetrahydrofolate cyclo-ligase [Lachnospiraceae bacterium]|nr:5-formyltetrahydrofolate cyclo-ligase [Lachnospiraceae bacterium]
MTDTDLKKKDIRKDFIKRRSGLAPDKKALYDTVICDRITSMDEYNDAGLVLVYASYNGEVDTKELIKRCIKDGKSVACPRCRIEDGVPALDFYRIGSWDDLNEGYKGIPEPGADEDKKVSGHEIKDALIIVPMVGYDKSGNRLGYGKGFYDRFLAANKNAKSIGLAYSIQECDELPVDEYDVRPDMIINETGV